MPDITTTASGVTGVVSGGLTGITPGAGTVGISLVVGRAASFKGARGASVTLVVGTSTPVTSVTTPVVAGVILSPPDRAIIDTPRVLVTWSFSSTDAYTQVAWRVEVLNHSRVVYDSKFRPGTRTSHTPNFTLIDGQVYQIRLTLQNSGGFLSPPWVHQIEVHLPTTTPTPLEESVGVIYEVGINGQGYMLHDNRDQGDGQYRYGRRTGGLQAERFATGSTPFEQAIDRYSFGSMSDFRGGTGQEFADRAHSDPSAYLDSEGIDPFTPGRFSLLNSTEAEFLTISPNLRSVTVGGRFYTLIGDARLSYRDTHGGTPTDVLVGNIAAITGLTTDGTNWYASTGTDIRTGTTGSAVWSTIPFVNISYAAGRVIGSYKATGSVSPNRFTTLNAAGVEEVSNGRLTLPPGWAINSFTSGSGFIWFSTYNGSSSAVYAWKAGTDDSPFLAYEHQTGSRILAMLWEQGQIITITHDQNTTLSLWRFVPAQDGTLTAFLIDANYASSTSPRVGLAAYGAQVYFSWPSMTRNRSGVGILNLPTGGYCRGYEAGVAGEVPSVNIWQGKITLTVPGEGVWRQTDQFVQHGYLDTSHFDAASTLERVYDSVTVRTEPLQTGESVEVLYSTNKNVSYQLVTGARLDTPGEATKTIPLEVKARSMGVHVILNGSGATTPVVNVISLKYHQLGLADTVLTLPVDCSNNIRGLNGAALDNSEPGSGAARVRLLESLVQTRVTIQDIDWFDTRDTESYEMLDVTVTKRSLYNRAEGKQQLQQIAVCTLRKEQR